MSIQKCETRPQQHTLPEQPDRVSSLWAEYYKELGFFELLEREDGFLKFALDGNIATLCDFFIRKSARDGKLRRELFEEFTAIVKSRGADCIIGQVDTQLKGSTRRIMFWLKMGGEAFKAENNIIHFVKRI